MASPPESGAAEAAPARGSRWRRRLAIAAIVVLVLAVAIRAALPYARKMRQVIAHLAHAHAEYRHPFLIPREVKRVGLIVVSTDRGLCGGLNANLFRAVIAQMKEWGLVFSGLVPNLWSQKLIDTDDQAAYLAAFKKSCEFARDLGIKSIRVDTVQPPTLVDKIGYDTVLKRVTTAFKKCAEIAADYGLWVTWEFEPGFALNKPTGVVCTARDPAGRPRVTDLLPPNAGRVFAIGRLDMSSEGLILLTNDGELANRITHPRHGVEKLYHVQVMGMPTAEVLAEVRKGVYIDEGRISFKNVKLKSTRKSSAILEVVLDEGRNREIRRVLARVGHKVQKLQRIAVGPVRLGEMPVGSYRELTREEVTALREATTGKHKTIVLEKRPSGPRPDRKRPPHKAAPKKDSIKKSSDRPAAGSRRLIGVEEPKPETERPAAHRPHKHSATDKSTGRPARKPPIKKGVKKPGGKMFKPGGKSFNKSSGKGRSGSGGSGKPKGKR